MTDGRVTGEVLPTGLVSEVANVPLAQDASSTAVAASNPATASRREGPVRRRRDAAVTGGPRADRPGCRFGGHPDELVEAVGVGQGVPGHGRIDRHAAEDPLDRDLALLAVEGARHRGHPDHHAGYVPRRQFGSDQLFTAAVTAAHPRPATATTTQEITLPAAVDVSTTSESATSGRDSTTR